MESLSFKLLEQIESFKHKLTDAEYKIFVESLSDINKEEKKIEEKKNEKEYIITYLKIFPELKNPFVNRDHSFHGDPHYMRYFFDTEIKKAKLKLSLDEFEILQKNPYRPMNHFQNYHRINIEDYSLIRDIENSEEEIYIYDNDDNHENVLIQSCEVILLKIEPFIK